MPTTITLRRIMAEETHELRHEILRPHIPKTALVYLGDDASESLHAGAFSGDKLIGIASVFRDSPPGENIPSAWRLRGMATHPEMRRHGIGRALIEFCIAHIQSNGGTLLWCNGRTSARGFYEALGFNAVGDEFETSTGPHYVFRLNL